MLRKKTDPTNTVLSASKGTPLTAPPPGTCGPRRTDRGGKHREFGTLSGVSTSSRSSARTRSRRSRRSLPRRCSRAAGADEGGEPQARELLLDESRTLQSHGIGADAVINAVVTEEALKKETDEALKKDQKILQLAKDLDRWKKSYGIFVNKEEGDQRRKKAIEDARLVEAVRDAKAAVEADPRDRRKYERLIALATPPPSMARDDHDERARRRAAATHGEYKIDVCAAVTRSRSCAGKRSRRITKLFLKLKALVKEDIFMK